MPRKLHLNAFLMSTGHHEASWRLPESDPLAHLSAEHFIHLAQTAERGHFDSIFFADSPVLQGEPGRRPAGKLEPTILLTAIAARTSKIGLIATASTSYNDPYNLARRFASVDWVSGGRVGWNIVTTAGADAARNFGLDDTPDHAQRYEKAAEFVDVATKLWDSWDDDAFIGDKELGIHSDPDKVHATDHVGRFFRVAGPLNVPRSPQAYPVLVQAGSSEDGKNFAARYAEAIFTAHQSLANAQAFYSDIKSQAKGLGRNPDHIKILPGLSPFIADTETAAKELEREFNELTVPAYGLKQIRGLADVDLSALDLDAPVPLDAFGEAGNVTDNTRSRKQVVAEIVAKERPTVRRLLHRLAGARGHRVFAGTPEQVADTIEEWFTSGAADGFNVMPPYYPGGLTDFTEHVVPILQRRGLFRTEYTGTTLRDHLGLPRPENQFAIRQASAQSAS